MNQWNRTKVHLLEECCFLSLIHKDIVFRFLFCDESGWAVRDVIFRLGGVWIYLSGTASQVLHGHGSFLDYHVDALSPLFWSASGSRSSFRLIFIINAVILISRIMWYVGVRAFMFHFPDSSFILCVEICLQIFPGYGSCSSSSWNQDSVLCNSLRARRVRGHDCPSEIWGQ